MKSYLRLQRRSNKKRTRRKSILEEPATSSSAIPQRIVPELMGTSADSILNLQRTIGNRAILKMIEAQQQETPQSTELTPRHSLDIQRSKTGLAGKENMKKYVKKTGKLKSGWNDMNQVGRMDALLVPVNKLLVKLGVPPVRGIIDPFGTMQGTGENAAFNRGLWQVFVNPDILAPNVSDEEFARSANTIYHECRHAEQTFRVARKMAAEGMDAPTIAAAIGIHVQDAQAAVDKPLKPKQADEWQEAAAWQMNMQKGPHGEDALSDIVNAAKDAAFADYYLARRIYRTLERLFEGDITVGAENLALFAQRMQSDQGRALLEGQFAEAKQTYIEAREHAKQAYLQYAMMPVEQDAWDVGGRIEELFGFKPHTAEMELENLDADERTMIEITAPFVEVDMSEASARERELFALIGQTDM